MASPNDKAPFIPGSTVQQTKRTSTEQPAHSYQTLLAELATQTRNTIRLAGASATFEKLAQPTPLQAHAHQLARHAPVTA